VIVSGMTRRSALSTPVLPGRSRLRWPVADERGHRTATRVSKGSQLTTPSLFRSSESNILSMSRLSPYSSFASSEQNLSLLSHCAEQKTIDLFRVTRQEYHTKLYAAQHYAQSVFFVPRTPEMYRIICNIKNYLMLDIVEDGLKL